MINNDFINNTNVNESNSFVNLLQHIDPNYEEEVNIIENSIYYDNNAFNETLQQVKGNIRILNLNCGGLKSKFDKLKIFLSSINGDDTPLSIITLQETHFTSDTEVNLYNIPDYTLISDMARINLFGGIAIYVHNSFSYSRLPNDILKQNSPVYESMFIEINHNNAKFNKFIIGNIYRRPSEISDELNMFINEITESLICIQALSKKAYITGDFNIDLLKINRHSYYNTFYENITAHGFFPKITRPTRLSDVSSTLIDNIFTNNLCKKHTSGIITTPISDHLMNFCILECNALHPSPKIKFVEIEKINHNSINDFKNSIKKANIIEKINIEPLSDPNNNYNIFAATLID